MNKRKTETRNFLLNIIFSSKKQKHFLDYFFRAEDVEQLQFGEKLSNLTLFRNFVSHNKMFFSIIIFILTRYYNKYYFIRQIESLCLPMKNTP